MVNNGQKFIFQIDKKENQENVDLFIYYIDKENKTKIEKISIPYSIFVKKQDFDKLNLKSDKIIISKAEYFDINKEKVLKLDISDKEILDYIVKQSKDKAIKLYEADIDQKYHYLINNDIQLCEGKCDNISLNLLSIDIETVGKKGIENQEIIMISTHNPQNKKENAVLVNKEKLKKEHYESLKSTKFSNFQLRFYDNEHELLSEFKKKCQNDNIQAITGWNVIDFDMKVIKNRMQIHKIDFNLSNFEGEVKTRFNKEFMRDSTVEMPGLLIFDCIQLLKLNFISFEDYKLNTVAKEILKDEKIDIEMENGEEGMQSKLDAIKNMLEKNPKKLIEYNFKDSELVSKIIDKLNLLELMTQRSIITNTPLARIRSPIATLDMMYLRELHKRGQVAESIFNPPDSHPLEGAFVYEPRPGFYENVFVLDFKSLYPSIAMTFNIDPFSLDKKGEIVSPNKVRFRKEKGILPELIHKLYLERDIAKKNKDKIKSFALKITMNSFYGAVGSPKCRLYNKDVGEAITGFGRFLIKKAIDFAKDNGFETIYGDTDSIFIIMNINKNNIKLEEIEKIGKETETSINSFFKKYVMNDFEVESFLHIEFEKLYSKFFIASKKRYVGYDEISKELQFVGMEAVRGDWTELAKNFQVELIKMIFSDSDKNKIKNFIKEYIKNLESGKYDSLLVYKKKITKPLSQYVKTTPPHVKAARELKDLSGKLIKYVMLKEGPKHIKLVPKNPDYNYKHYIEKQLKGVSDDILESFGIDFDEVVGSSKQKKLSKFF
jgi:DNA polymerase-2